MRTKRLKLPPLVRYQSDTRRPDGWVPSMTMLTYSNEDRAAGRAWPEPNVVRRLSDGKVVFMNEAAKRAGL